MEYVTIFVVSIVVIAVVEYQLWVTMRLINRFSARVDSLAELAHTHPRGKGIWIPADGEEGQWKSIPS